MDDDILNDALLALEYYGYEPNPYDGTYSEE